MKLNLGYPGLCLCLFFSLLIMSCTVKRTGTLQVLPTVNNHELYQLEVKLIMNSPMDDFQGEFAPYLVQPYDMKYGDNVIVFRPTVLTLYFRFPDFNLLQQCY
jgi:hypothetical protein